MKPVCVILAGGRSSRMGGSDKALMMLNGTAMLGHVLAAMIPQSCAVLITSNSDPRFFRHYPHPVVADCLPGRLGPLAGLLTGMMWSRQHRPEATHLLSVPCDTPLLPVDLGERLTAALTGSHAQISIARDSKRRHPTLGLWPISLAEHLAADLTRHRVRAMQAWLAQFTVTEVLFEAQCLSNINTRDELNALTLRSSANTASIPLRTKAGDRNGPNTQKPLGECPVRARGVQPA